MSQKRLTWLSLVAVLAVLVAYQVTTSARDDAREPTGVMRNEPVARVDTGAASTPQWRRFAVVAISYAKVSKDAASASFSLSAFFPLRSLK